MSTLRIAYPTELAQARGLDPQKWGVLINTTFPGAQTASAVINAYDLAQVRGLDVFMGHIAIVSQRRKVDNNWINQESCWLTLKAQIYTAHKTGAFAGIDPIQYGPMVERNYTGFRRQDGGPNAETALTITVPEYVTATVYRFVNGQRCAFSDTLFFDEAVPMVNKMPSGLWAKSPAMMLSKCAKAAALRLGFAECDYSADEMHEQAVSPVMMADLSVSSNDAMTEANNQFSLNSDVVTAFADMSDRAVRWLDRTADTAAAIGAFDEAKDNIKATLEPRYHDIAIALIEGIKGIFTDPRGRALWGYLNEARKRGNDGCEAAGREIAKQQGNNALTDAAARGARQVLDLYKVLLNLGAAKIG